MPKIRLMSLTEASIYKRPQFSLTSWYLHDVDGEVRIRGEWKGEAKESAELRFLDTEQQVAIDADGTVWHLPPHASAMNAGRSTEELVTLYRQPRWVRKPAVLVIADDCPKLRRLLSKGTKT